MNKRDKKVRYNDALHIIYINPNLHIHIAPKITDL